MITCKHCGVEIDLFCDYDDGACVNHDVWLHVEVPPDYDHTPEPAER